MLLCTNAFSQESCDSLLNKSGVLEFYPEFTPEEMVFGEEFCVTFKTRNYNDIISFQITFSFDPAEIEYVDFIQESTVISGTIAQNESFTDNGLISILHFEQSGVGRSLDDDTELFTLCFNSIETTSACVDIDIANTLNNLPKTEINHLYSDTLICTTNKLQLDGGDFLCIPLVCDSLTIIKESICNSENAMGSAQLSFCGGATPYTVEVIQGGSVIENRTINSDFELLEIADLSSNIYEVNVTDAIGQTSTTNFEIEDKPGITYDQPVVVNPFCPTGVNGFVEINNVTNGNNDNFKISFSNDFVITDTNDALLEKLGNGDYFVTIEDSKGCEVVDSFTVLNPPITIDVTFEPCCTEEQNDGYLMVVPSGGTPLNGFYNINGTQAAFFESFTPCMDANYDSTNGTYNIRIADGNGCLYNEEVVLPSLLDNTPVFGELPKDLIVYCELSGVSDLNSWYDDLGRGTIDYTSSAQANYSFKTAPDYDELLSHIINCNDFFELPVEAWVEDDCGNISERQNLIFAVIPAGGGVSCAESCVTITNGCHSCNVQNLLDGFQSRTPKFENESIDWPDSLCGGGKADNISWFSFVAGNSELYFSLNSRDCVPGLNSNLGLEAGILDGCSTEGGMCLGGANNCGSETEKLEFTVSNLNVGEIYYLYIDGCDGSNCEYEILIERGLEYALDTPDEVVVSANCEQLPVTPQNQFCNESILQFGVTHQGDSPTNFGMYDMPGPYSTDINADFHWTFSLPIEGMSQGSWNPRNDGYPIPPLSFSNVSVETNFEICLTEIIAECSEVQCDDCCTMITISPLPDEYFGPYDVCVEELLDADGWDPSQVGDDPNGDGSGWAGSSNITLSDVNDAIANNNGIIAYTTFDENCNCPLNQLLEINPVGNSDTTDLTLHMFDCQFRTDSGVLDNYTWILENDKYDLDVDMENELFDISGASIQGWDGSSCDRCFCNHRYCNCYRKSPRGNCLWRTL